MELDDLFRCPAVGRDLAVKHCLRRQDEKRDELPVRAECQGCGVGAAHCAACGPLPAPQPAEVAPALTGRPLPPEHLWTSEVPDVPLGPPPTQLKAHPWYGPEGEARARPGEPESLLDGEDEAVELEAPETPRLVVEKPEVHAQPASVRPHSSSGGRDAPPRPEVVHAPDPRDCATPQPAAAPPAAPAAAAAPPPTQENEMPCTNCKKTGHNARSCPDLLSVGRGPVARTTARKLAAAPARKAARRGKPSSSLLGELEALKERGRARLEEIEQEVQLHQDAIDKLHAEVAELHRFFGMDRPRAELAQAVG